MKKESIEYTISAPEGLKFNFKELWQFRELFYFFTWRDIKVKYKQTILGFLWAILQPLLLMGIFIFFFSHKLDLSTDGIPPAIFYFSGLLLWNLFSQSISGAGNSMINNANIIKKIYFPRLVIPLSSVLTSLFDFLMAVIIFFCLLGYYSIQGIQIDWIRFLLYFPSSILLCLLTSFGLGTLLASLNVKYRDFRYVIPFLIQLLFFLSPIIYPTSLLNSPILSRIIALNPMTAVIHLARSPFNDISIDWVILGIGISSALVIFLIGLINFKRTEAYFADLA